MKIKIDEQTLTDILYGGVRSPKNDEERLERTKKAYEAMAQILGYPEDKRANQEDFATVRDYLNILGFKAERQKNDDVIDNVKEILDGKDFYEIEVRENAKTFRLEDLLTKPKKIEDFMLKNITEETKERLEELGFEERDEIIQKEIRFQLGDVYTLIRDDWYQHIVHRKKIDMDILSDKAILEPLKEESLIKEIEQKEQINRDPSSEIKNKEINKKNKITKYDILPGWMAFLGAPDEFEETKKNLPNMMPICKENSSDDELIEVTKQGYVLLLTAYNYELHNTKDMQNSLIKSAIAEEIGKAEDELSRRIKEYNICDIQKAEELEAKIEKTKEDQNKFLLDYYSNQINEENNNLSKETLTSQKRVESSKEIEKFNKAFDKNFFPTGNDKLTINDIKDMRKRIENAVRISVEKECDKDMFVMKI